MKMDIKTKWPIAALSFIGMASTVSAAQNNVDRCAPEPGAICYPDDCVKCAYCLGPENYGVNAPVCPKTCDGDFIVEVAGFYWSARQDGMEYAIRNGVTIPVDFVANDLTELVNLVDAKYETLDSSWDGGFKLGVGYCSACDGWDVGVTWTWFKNTTSSHLDAHSDSASVFIPLWSAYASQFGQTNFVRDIETHWKLELNLVDIELGREYWVSKYLTMRPFVGVRVAWIYQDFTIKHKGGVFAIPLTTAFNNEVDLENNFRGAGLRGGLDTVWNFGCGWGLYGNLAFNLVYGRFCFTHEEDNRTATGNHDKVEILETSSSFRATRAMFDLGFGLQWAAMICDCKYGLLISFGWEQHLFFDQNQFWRTVRIGDTIITPNGRNNTGENIFHQRRGDLDTQGVTLRVQANF